MVTSAGLGAVVDERLTTSLCFSGLVHLRHRGLYRSLIELRGSANVSNYNSADPDSLKEATKSAKS